MTDITPVATREPAAPDLPAIRERLNGWEYDNAQELIRRHARYESHNNAPLVDAAYLMMVLTQRLPELIAEIERLRAAPPALQEMAAPCRAWGCQADTYERACERLSKTSALQGQLIKAMPCPPPSYYYKCFHCGEVFVDEESAARHFGPRDPNNPLHRREIRADAPAALQGAK